jgi:Flp pilus assembly protein TadD
MLVLDEALADAPAPEEPLDEIELDQLVSEPVETAEKVEPRDFAHEEGLFEDRRFTPEPSAAAQDLSHEDDLFEERVFEEDSFENEMVEERPTSNAIDADPEPGALVEIEALLSGESDATPANPEAELEPDPRSEMKRDEAPPEPKAEREPSKKKRARKKKRKKEQEGRGKRKQRKKAAPNPVEVQEVEAGTPADEAVAEAAKPEVTAEPKVAAQPEVRTEPGASPAKEPKPTVTEDSRSGYEIAPFGTIQTDAKERAIIAERVRQRADRRVGHLIDRAGKQVGTTTATPSGHSEAERALQAESWFRTGRDRLKAKKYDEAVEAFGMSAHLDPAEGEYVSHLGYALYLSKPDHELVRKEALEDIARGIKLSPDREISYVFLGRIFKVGGELLNAEKMFRRALEIRPHCREAAQELRLIEMREQKKNAGFFGRFLK